MSINTKEWLKKSYIVLMTVCLLWYLWSLATFSNQYRTPVWVWAVRCAAAGLAVYLGKLWKDKGFIALAVFYVLILVRVWFLNNQASLADRSVQESLFMGIWLFFACYGLARVLNRKELERYLAVLVAIWTAGIVLYSLTGIYAAWTGLPVYTIGGRSKWFVDNDSVRLNLIFNNNTGASLLSVSALILLCAAWTAKHRWIKAVSVPAVIVMMIAMSLTGSRTSLITFALGMSGMAGLTLFRRLLLQNHWKKGLSIAISLVCFLTLSVGTVYLSIRAFDWFYAIKLHRASLIPTALAETAEGGESVWEQQMLFGRTLTNGREEIWKAVFEYIKAKPLTLLYGTSIYNPVAEAGEMAGFDFTHCHGTLLQVLLESGIPGLILICIFLFVLIRRGIRLMKHDKKRPGWMVLLPVAVFAICAGETLECFIVLLRPYTPQQALVFICMGIICAYGKKRGDEITDS